MSGPMPFQLSFLQPEPGRDLVQIVCEGACSPNLSLAEADVRDFRRRTYGGGGAQLPIPDALASRLRVSSTITPHKMTTATEACCTACGQRRKYGLYK